MQRITFGDLQNEEFTQVLDANEEISHLSAEHQRLDTKITAISESTNCNQLEIKRLKKRKLWIKDKILFLKSQLEPNIIA